MDKKRGRDDGGMVEGKRRRTTTNLPIDVIEQVLLRLPARSVVKFRSVCKVFDELSTSPLFLSTHVQRSRKNPPLFVVSKERRCVRTTLSSSKVPVPKSMSPFVCAEIHTCDGMICFFTYGSEFTLFNPLTREFFHAYPPYIKSDTFDLLHFYYHAPSQNYRVLCKYEDYTNLPPRYHVFTFGPNTFTPVPNDTPFTPQTLRKTVLIQGNLLFFWASKLGGRKPEYASCIGLFHTETHRFTHLPLPKGVDHCQWAQARVELLDIEGKLCICQLDSATREIKLWVLKDYNNNRGIWIRKKHVKLQRLKEDQQQDFIPVCYNNILQLLLHVQSGTIDILSPDIDFTFYYLNDDQIFDTVGVATFLLCMGYKETLAIVR